MTHLLDMTENVSATPLNCSNRPEIFRTNEALNLMTANPQIEQWLPVTCAPTYEVSNHGRIRCGDQEAHIETLRAMRESGGCVDDDAWVAAVDAAIATLQAGTP